MKSTKIVVLLMGVVISKFAQAQDITFSQFFNNKIYLNPAFAGNEFGTRAQASSRLQWPKTPGEIYLNNAYVEGSVSSLFNRYKVDGGIGLMLNQTIQGEGKLTSNEASVIITKSVPIIEDDKSKLFLTFALQPVISNTTVNWDKFVFSDQLDPVLGKIYESRAERPGSTSIFNGNLNGGLLIRYKKKIQKKWDWVNSLGFSVKHLLNARESFFGFNERLSARYVVHYTSTIRLFHRTGSMGRNRQFESFYLTPTLVFEQQASLRTLNSGFYISQSFASNNQNEPSLGLFGGILYRNRRFLIDPGTSDALILMAGMNLLPGNPHGKNKSRQSYQFSLSHDFTTSGLGSTSGGAWEIHLLFNFIPNKNKPTAICYGFKDEIEQRVFTTY